MREKKGREIQRFLRVNTWKRHWHVEIVCNILTRLPVGKRITIFPELVKISSPRFACHFASRENRRRV